jgi:GNAT superfamily N-acetyltransferase
VIRATPADRDAIMAFLMTRPTVAMFPITNLRDHGMEGGHPKAMRFWMAQDGGQITDVLGISDSGVVLPVFSTNQPRDIRAALQSCDITGIIGQGAPVSEVKAALELPDGTLNRVEPHFELALERLKMPNTTGLSIVPVAAVPREEMIVWRRQYGIDALDLEPSESGIQAIDAVDRMIARNTHRVLLADGAPVAVTGFNAILPEAVMVGGVYTPKYLRGRGFARAALALHLAEARSKGVKRAVLSAANAIAAKTYTAIGFQQIGDFMIVLYDTPQTSNV